jgi:polysaccharide pyruvyl transferase WcaK-like protein
VAAVPIDTRLDVNRQGFASPAQIESAIAKMDAILTTRLHGAALALRRGVPPVAIDSVPGGSKLLRQMERIGWPLAFQVGDLDPAAVSVALDRALSAEARELALECAARARREVDVVEEEFLAVLAPRSVPSTSR